MKRSSENDHSSPVDGENVDPNTASRTALSSCMGFLQKLQVFIGAGDSRHVWKRSARPFSTCVLIPSPTRRRRDPNVNSRFMSNILQKLVEEDKENQSPIQVIKRKDHGPSTKNQLEKLASGHDSGVKVL
ncbi:uncharacterized protein LOC108219718 isoform X2 [Daucus carota subsp. sativus]|uniref:uncharacterized protein LOC108219718 isoform X2 n=1 Tax=Daucus carota subsp. sativus TaxID=79200 RepID=UPI0030833C6A